LYFPTGLWHNVVADGGAALVFYFPATDRFRHKQKSRKMTKEKGRVFVVVASFCLTRIEEEKCVQGTIEEKEDISPLSHLNSPWKFL